MHNPTTINLFYVPLLHDSHFDGLIYRKYSQELP